MSSVPEFLPLYQPIYEASETKISQLLEMVKSTYNPLPPFFLKYVDQSTLTAPTLENDHRLFAYSYLVARNWNVKEAFKMLQVSVAQRKRLGVDDFVLFPSYLSLRGYDVNEVPKVIGYESGAASPLMAKAASVVGGVCHVGYHYWDKRGLPVAYMLLGQIDTSTAVKRIREHVPVGTSFADFLDIFSASFVETGWGLCRYQDKVLRANPQPGIDMGAVRRNFVTLVLDCRGLTYKSIDTAAIEKLKVSVQHLNATYADCIHRVLVVNCPGMIKFAYNIVKASMNEGLQKKFVFVSPENTPAALDRVIGKERVPSFLGGSCNCAGGCVASYTPGAIFSAEEHCGGTGDVVTEDIKLSAGEKHQKVFELKQGEEVVWEFVSTKGADVRFSIYFYPKQDGVSVDSKSKKVKIDKKVKRTTAEDPHVKSEKVSDGADSFTAPQDGILQLVWDNSKSWVQDKPMQMRVYKCEALLESPVE